LFSSRAPLIKRSKPFQWKKESLKGQFDLFQLGIILPDTLVWVGKIGQREIGGEGKGKSESLRGKRSLIERKEGGVK
jgi:hypothetical protein